MVSSVLVDRLARIGWSSQRRVPEVQIAAWKKVLCCENGFHWFDAVESVLRRYGGLEYLGDHQGEEVVTMAFKLDPLECLGENWDFMALEKTVHERGSPLGIANSGHGLLAITESGRVMEIALADHVLEWGVTMEDALERMMLGRKWISRVPLEDPEA